MVRPNIDQDTWFGNNSAVFYGNDTASYSIKIVRLTEEEYLSRVKQLEEA